MSLIAMKIRVILPKSKNGIFAPNLNFVLIFK